MAFPATVDGAFSLPSGAMGPDEALDALEAALLTQGHAANVQRDGSVLRVDVKPVVWAMSFKVLPTQLSGGVVEVIPNDPVRVRYSFSFKRGLVFTTVATVVVVLLQLVLRILLPVAGEVLTLCWASDCVLARDVLRAVLQHQAGVAAAPRRGCGPLERPLTKVSS